ncbi:MAG: carboxylating nicotinate-nucleotide diphosphorylase [Bdellovibrionia bacterium]
MYHEQIDLWKNLLYSGLKDDGYPWDWTSIGTTKNSDQQLTAKIVGKSEGVWAGEALVTTLGRIAGFTKAESLIKNGEKFKSGSTLVSLTGLSRELLALERPFLNLAAYVSGIATKTHQFAKLIKEACPNRTPRLTLTRKTLPSYRDVAIYGVLAGGGFPHRVSLSGGILIKENHVAAAGGISNAIKGAQAVAPHGLKIEIEVRSEQELKEALNAGAEGVLLDNFSPSQIRSALKVINKNQHNIFVEVSGGLTESNISDYAIEGVDVLSVGALTHSVKAVDLSLLVQE